MFACLLRISPVFLFVCEDFSAGLGAVLGLSFPLSLAWRIIGIFRVYTIILRRKPPTFLHCSKLKGVWKVWFFFLLICFSSYLLKVICITVSSTWSVSRTPRRWSTACTRCRAPISDIPNHDSPSTPLPTRVSCSNKSIDCIEVFLSVCFNLLSRLSI